MCSPLVTGHIACPRWRVTRHFFKPGPVCIVRNRKLKTRGSAQHFHRVSANTNVGDLLTVACRPHKDFTGSSGFDSLANENLLVRFCQPMAHHPTDGATSS